MLPKQSLKEIDEEIERSIKHGSHLEALKEEKAQKLTFSNYFNQKKAKTISSQASVKNELRPDS